jgi:precorrin-6A/cobalt-precorrin-6A reductase
VRIGGFGGADGLADYLRAARIGLMIDATHPFATRIKANARAASAAAAVPLVAIDRPRWRAEAGDRWIMVDDAAAAARAAADLGARIWLTLGADGVSAFAALTGKWFLVRRVDRTEAELNLPEHEIIFGRGPFSVDGERAIIERYRIDALVTKASGGQSTVAKLAAARAARIPVVMIRRPAAPVGDTVGSVEAALDWLSRRLAD